MHWCLLAKSHIVLIGKNYNVMAKYSGRSKITPIDYKHNWTGLHEITICNDCSNSEKAIPGHQFLHLKQVHSGERVCFCLIGNFEGKNKNSNINKPTAKWISNKNANVWDSDSMIANACWLRRLWKTLTVHFHWGCCSEKRISVFVFFLLLPWSSVIQWPWPTGQKSIHTVDRYR